MVFGVWCLVFGVWCLVLGACCMCVGSEVRQGLVLMRGVDNQSSRSKKYVRKTLDFGAVDHSLAHTLRTRKKMRGNLRPTTRGCWHCCKNLRMCWSS